MDALTPSSAARDTPDRPFLVTDERTLTFAEVADHCAHPSLDTPHCFRAVATVESLLTALAALEQQSPFFPIHERLPESEALALTARVRAARLDGVAVVLATSGSTGQPKLVLHSRASLIAAARASAENLGWQEGDRWLLCLPIAHIGGLSVLTRCLLARRTVVALPRFEPGAMLDAIEEQGVTLVSVVPTQLAALLEQPRAAALSKLRAILVGGASLSEPLRRAARERALPILATYGCTEMGSQICTQSPRSIEDSGSGRPLVGVQLAITNGKILTNGPMRMLGYLGEPALAADEWFDTGDLGHLDESGQLHVLGRSDDLIVTGGENVHPAEVDRALLTHAKVSAALTVGVPEPRWGQIVAALLVLLPGSDPSSVLAQVNAGLPSFRRVRRYAVVDALPVTASGKLDRAAAREILNACSLAPTTL